MKLSLLFAPILLFGFVTGGLLQQPPESTRRGLTQNEIERIRGTHQLWEWTVRFYENSGVRKTLTF